MNLLGTSKSTCIIQKGFGDNDRKQILNPVDPDTISKVICIFWNLKRKKPVKCPYLGPCTTCCYAPGGIGGCQKTMWGKDCRKLPVSKG